MLTLCKKYSPNSLNLIITTLVNCRSKKLTDYRYCNEFKQLALTIYFLGPKVYRFLQSTLALPNPCKLKHIIKR
jgi:hypothetical protein